MAGVFLKTPAIFIKLFENPLLFRLETSFSGKCYWLDILIHVKEIFRIVFLL